MDKKEQKVFIRHLAIGGGIGLVGLILGFIMKSLFFGIFVGLIGGLLIATSIAFRKLKV